ncbi:hypothetical protein N1F78_06270 [Seonamhaeicola sp. MEBiC1930]|uniref:hypothetical protein n=1 Tax=Seonamhaeicola sp. MEBiC01930 TaxID=2976768 RepID=UPI003245B0E0
MSKDSPQPQQSEEVDLGQLFKFIGKAFDRLSKFISNIFIGVYKVTILILIHIYKRLVWYVSAVLVGVVLGFIIDSNSEKLYGANMHIQTNYNSARQVYENIKQFHQLASIDKDTSALAEKLNLTLSEASSLKGFFIEPDIDENEIAEMYSDFYQRLDSISQLEMTYDRYKNSLTPYNFSIHRIGVSSEDKHIYKRIQASFINGISKNEYLDNLLKANVEILQKKDKSLFDQVKKTDSLAGEYLKIRIKESNKEILPGTGTNLYLGDSESSSGSLIVDESKVLQLRLRYEQERRKIDSAYAIKKNIINVMADFPESGYDIREWYDKMKLLLPVVLFSITVLIFSVIGLGRFLNEQSKN